MLDLRPQIVPRVPDSARRTPLGSSTTPPDLDFTLGWAAAHPMASSSRPLLASVRTGNAVHGHLRPAAGRIWSGVVGHRSRLAGAAASEDGELEAVKSAGVEWVLREALLALVRAGATFEAGKLVERPDEHPQPEAA